METAEVEIWHQKLERLNHFLRVQQICNYSMLRTQNIQKGNQHASLLLIISCELMESDSNFLTCLVSTSSRSEILSTTRLKCATSYLCRLMLIHYWTILLSIKVDYLRLVINFFSAGKRKVEGPGSCINDSSLCQACTRHNESLC